MQQIKEKTYKSSPMRPSFSAGTPDSSVSEGDGSFYLHAARKGSAPARTMTSGTPLATFNASLLVNNFLIGKVEVIRVAVLLAVIRIRNTGRFNHWTVVVKHWVSFYMNLHSIL